MTASSHDLRSNQRQKTPRSVLNPGVRPVTPGPRLEAKRAAHCGRGAAPFRGARLSRRAHRRSFRAAGRRQRFDFSIFRQQGRIISGSLQKSGALVSCISGLPCANSRKGILRNPALLAAAHRTAGARRLDSLSRGAAGKLRSGPGAEAGDQSFSCSRKILTAAPRSCGWESRAAKCAQTLIHRSLFPSWTGPWNGFRTRC